VLAIMFGAYALVNSIFAVVASISAPKGQPRWWVTLLEDVVGTIVGVLTFIMYHAKYHDAVSTLPDRGVGNRDGHLRGRGGNPPA
jgi:uncharacterized membrane protein HdeD (DUF308 family)